MDKKDSLNDEQYRLTQEMLVSIGRQLALLDLPGFLKRINLAHSIAPVLDPTLYRQGAGNLRDIEALTRAFLPAWRHIQELKETRPGKAL